MTQPRTLCGVYPQLGDLAGLTRSASVLFGDEPTWFRVESVRPSSISGWVYLHGWYADEDDRVLRSVYVRVEGLVIRRGVV